MNRKIFVSGFLSICALPAVLQMTAMADYYLPPPKKKLVVLSDNWKVLQQPETQSLRVVHGRKTYEWPVEKMWLADRVCSDAICTGGYQTETKEYLNKLEASARNRPLIIELVDTKGNGTYFIAGLWLFNADSRFPLETQSGSIFGLSADEVKTLKTPAEYEKRTKQISDANWISVLSTTPADPVH